MSIYNQIRGIKAFRQDKAERTVIQSRQALEDSEAQRRLMEKRLNEHRERATELERDYYRDLCTRVVKMRDIEDVQFSIQQLKVQEIAHEEAVTTAEKARVKAQETLKVDTVQLQTASKMHQKFIELADAHAKELECESERKEELELEEAAGSSGRVETSEDY